MPLVVIADGQGMYRRGLRESLEEALPELTVYAVETFDSALAILAGDEAIRLAIFDLLTPGLHSLGDLREVHRNFPLTRFCILASQASSELVLLTLATGLHGFIAKSQPDGEVVAAVADMLSGRIYVPPWLSDAKLVTQTDTAGQAQSSAKAASLARLTPRQRDVLTLLAKGQSNKEISRSLSISETTTKIHVGSLMRALSVRNRTEAAILLQTWMIET